MNAKYAFQHVKSMTGTDNNANQPSPSDPIDLRHRPQPALHKVRQTRLLYDIQVDNGSVTITEADVRHRFQRIKTSKTAGPDGIPGRLLHDCADSLFLVFQPIFQVPFDSGTVPTLWKTSLIVQVPKKPKPTEMKHYRSVALTPLAMKILEKIMLKNLFPFVHPSVRLSFKKGS